VVLIDLISGRALVERDQKGLGADRAAAPLATAATEGFEPPARLPRWSRCGDHSGPDAGHGEPPAVIDGLDLTDRTRRPHGKSGAVASPAASGWRRKLLDGKPSQAIEYPFGLYW
jgi:hypothetical protein